MWFEGWDDVFSSQEWGKYPGEELIRFVARRFYSVPDRKAVRILELGCGTGANVWFLAREGFSVTGMDGSRVAIEQARTRLAAEGLSAELHVGDINALPFPAESFDAVIDVECLSCNSLKDTRATLAEALRVLRPGGWIYSKTFCAGMTGEATAVRLEGEPRTYVEMREGPLAKRFGLVRLTAEDEIPEVYGAFEGLEWDIIQRSDRNRSVKLGEWIISGRKPA